MSEVQVAEQAASVKKEVVRTPVTMEDGSVFEFAGERQTSKSISFDPETGQVKVTFRYRNGAIRVVDSAKIPRNTLLQALGHGLSQKVGDESASIKTGLDDVILATEDMIGRLEKGEWGAVREAGDSMSGASVVIQALVKFTGKTVVEIKTFLDGKIEKAKAAGQKLSRQELYASFRAPGTPVAGIIKELEEAKVAKVSKVSAVDLMAELTAPTAAEPAHHAHHAH